MLALKFTPFPILKTKRLTLRQLALDDEQVIFTLRSDQAVNKFLDRKIAFCHTEAREFINAVNENINTNSSIYWAICFSDNTELIGTICLYCFSDENKKCEIGFELLTDFQKKGIMQEAVDVVIDYAFISIGVQTIEAFFHRDNQSSKLLLEKCSFRNSNKINRSNPDLLCYYLNSSKTIGEF